MICGERSRAPSMPGMVQAMCHKRQQINPLILLVLGDLHSQKAKIM
jgi:hypothetical protein